MVDEQPGVLLPTERFSDRVAFYELYRPRYPLALLPFLEKEIGLHAQSVIADIGSGTGFLAELFVRAGYLLYGVEPNSAMRAAAEARFDKANNFQSVAAQAESTMLPHRSIDLIVVGQAFHWFDLKATRAEFQSILKPGGWLALVYNSWHVANSPVAASYEHLVERYGVDYKRVTRQHRLHKDLVRFFGAGGPRRERFENDQSYDFEALRGRVLSSSYAPLPGQANYEPLMAGLRELFEAHAVDGRLHFPYVTTVYWGRLK